MGRRTLMQQLVKYEHACCIFGYFHEWEERSAREMARHLGVTPRTIRLYRQKIRTGGLTCPNDFPPAECPKALLRKGLDTSSSVQSDSRISSNSSGELQVTVEDPLL